MTCATCRYWQLQTDRYDELVFPYKPGDGFEQCASEEEAAAQRGYRLRYCKSPGIVFYQQPQRNGAAVCDGSQYRGVLLTAEDFGCVLHESVER